MTVLTNPFSVNHGFGYNKVNLQDTYQTPISGNYSYVYNKDRDLIQTNFPSGKQINNIYDKTRLMQIQTPEGNIDFTYLWGQEKDQILNIDVRATLSNSLCSSGISCFFFTGYKFVQSLLQPFLKKYPLAIIESHELLQEHRSDPVLSGR